MLTDDDDNVLDSKTVQFNSTEGCVYCPDGQCTCEVCQVLLAVVCSVCMQW